MKRMRMFYLSTIFVLCTATLVMFSGIARAGEVPDGFAGIPWGASHDQINKTMSQRSYRQITSEVPGGLIFKGAFAEASCQLYFNLTANSFHPGKADFCDISPDPRLPQATFNRIIKMLSEKYGPPRLRQSEPEVLLEHVSWQFIDSRSSDKYSIRVHFWHCATNDGTGTPKYSVEVIYAADSLRERLKKKEY